MNQSDELGAIAPDEDTGVSRSDYKVARRILRVKKTGRVDEVAEALVTLVQMVVKLLNEGDEGGAVRLGQSIIDLTESHLQGIHQGRGHIRPSEGLLPVAPTIKAEVSALLGGLSGVRTSVQREVLTGITHKVMSLGDSDDALVALAVTQLQVLPRDDMVVGSVEDVLREAAVRALSDNDTNGLRLIRDAVARLLTEYPAERRSEVLDLANYVAINAVWLNYWQAKPSWDWYWSLEDDSQHVTVKAIRAMRVGGAALLAGNVSVARKVALDLRGAANLGELERLARFPIVASREQFRGQLFGSYLGPDAEDAMARFARFAASVSGSSS